MTSAAATGSAPPAPIAQDRAFFGHPRGLSTLFFTEMWERFSYYGMRALLILFMTAAPATGGLGFDTATAGAIYGLYTSMVYLASLPGGWVADRLMGQRRAVLYGGILIAIGNFCLVAEGLGAFYTGLTLIVLGTGLLKPNVSVIVGQLYSREDTRRDAGFSIFYMGINVGATIAPLIVGWLAQAPSFRATLAGMGITPETSWHWGFGVGAIGMFFGLIQYVLGWKHFGEAGIHPSVAPDSDAGRSAWRQFRFGMAGLAVLVAVAAYLVGTGILSVIAVANVFSWSYLVVVVAFFVWLFGFGDWTPEERKRLIVILVLFVGAAVFWSAFEQAASTLNLFANQNTRNEFLGIPFPSSWFQSVNAVMIIALAPFFAWLWVKLGKRDPSSPAKFAVGLFFVGLGFAVMIGAAAATAGGRLVSPGWLVMTYMLHTIANSA